jgi:excisionase family DNA binding protein
MATPNVSVGDAARHYGVSTRTIRRRIAEGKLRAYRVGGQIRIDRGDLERLARPIPTGAGRE